MNENHKDKKNPKTLTTPEFLWVASKNIQPKMKLGSPNATLTFPWPKKDSQPPRSLTWEGESNITMFTLVQEKEPFPKYLNQWLPWS